MKTPFIQTPLLILVGICLLACSLLLVLLDLSQTAWLWMVALSVPACGLLVLASVSLWRPKELGRWWWVVLLGVGILARVSLFSADHMLSDDAARYHWDGKVLVHGINPYLWAPDDERLGHLRRTPLDELVNHPDVRTVYPPMAQLIFALGYVISPGSLFGLQLLFLLSELVTWLLLARELKRRGQPPSWLLFAVWCPLLIYEGYLPGHVDLLTLPFVTVFAIEARRGRSWLAGLALALACLIKPFPLILAPAAVFYLGWRKSLSFMAIFAIATVVLYIPFLNAGEKLFGSTMLMAREWTFNGTIALAVLELLPPSLTRPALGLMIVVLVLVSALRRAALLDRFLLAITAMVACSPFVFPWYLSFAVPLLVLRPTPTLLVLVALLPVTEVVMIDYTETNIWERIWWPKLVAFVPFYVICVAQAWRKRGMFALEPQPLD